MHRRALDVFSIECCSHNLETSDDDIDIRQIPVLTLMGGLSVGIVFRLVSGAAVRSTYVGIVIDVFSLKLPYVLHAWELLRCVLSGVAIRPYSDRAFDRALAICFFLPDNDHLL